jgi:hypothetical protein
MSLFTKIVSSILTLLPILAYAGGPDYAVGSIPAALKENANAIVRLDETNIRVNSLTDVRYTHHYVITVLNTAGLEHAEFTDTYNQIASIRSVSGAMYDESGKLIRKLKQSDIKDKSAVNDNSLMTDVRVKTHSFLPTVYPCTIEYTVEEAYETTLNIPIWSPQFGYDCALEHGVLTVETPADFLLRYKGYQFKDVPVITNEKSKTLYTWEVNQVKAMKPELFAGRSFHLLPTLFLAPGTFKLGDKEGDMKSWNSYGTFFYKLNSGRDVLPENTKATVHKLIEGKDNWKDKVKTLYQYLQDHTRYLNISFGIGGWQTIDAATVASKGYGDCKALSNYMMAMLKEAGIASNVVIIRAGEGEGEIIHDFPSNQFNHVIVCVPHENDTMWLECTNQYLQPGYLSSFTSDRYAVLVDESNSKLVRTPVYGTNENQQIRAIDATVNANGDAVIKCKTLYGGLEQDDLQGMIRVLGKDKQLEYLRKRFDFGSYDILDFQYKELALSMPTIEEVLTINANSYAAVTGKRIFIAPNFVEKANYNLQKNDNRKAPVEITYSYKDVDSVTITLPDGYIAESVPKPVALETKFGRYSNQCTVTGNKLTFIRKRESYKGEYPAADYNHLVDYLNALSTADRAKVVLVKK